ncbi:LIM/homeobox protein Lhx1 [Lingula anatina]|uniref:LIM/homeobox protein Lhx1 n=1 Tax=Lingula anatina TaxID=7574 RepID=A0A1S3K9N6_LINAN|nr:LIM/homeobox protein Lhx1 [Lingula anatina]|eukprot:XP_013419343.1 LIM/homeobox protein Lhx1 [Lingula anatina]
MPSSPKTDDTTMFTCAYCQNPIKEKLVLAVSGLNYHRRCLRCVVCREFLTDICFRHSGALYCKSDFIGQFGAICAGCHQVILPDEMSQCKQGLAFHDSPECFPPSDIT